MRKFYLIIAAALLLASCTEDPDGKLQTGTYAATVPDGVLCVEVISKKDCDVYLEGYDVFHGSYSIEGDLFSIKGYATMPYQHAEPGTITENWRNNYTFTGSTGVLNPDGSFGYFVDVQRPLGGSSNGKRYFIFTKR